MEMLPSKGKYYQGGYDNCQIQKQNKTNKQAENRDCLGLTTNSFILNYQIQEYLYSVFFLISKLLICVCFLSLNGNSFQ